MSALLDFIPADAQTGISAANIQRKRMGTVRTNLPWHGAAQEIPDNATIDEVCDLIDAIDPVALDIFAYRDPNKLIRLPEGVSLGDALTEDMIRRIFDASQEMVPGNRAIRDHYGRYLSVMGSDYKIHSPRSGIQGIRGSQQTGNLKHGNGNEEKDNERQAACVRM